MSENQKPQHYLLNEYRPSMDHEVLHSWAVDCVTAINAYSRDLGDTPNSVSNEYRKTMNKETLQAWATSAWQELERLVTAARAK